MENNPEPNYGVLKNNRSCSKDPESLNKNEGAGTGTEFGTVTNIIKNTVGAGILVLPAAFYKGGFILGCLVLLIVCSSCAYSFYMLGKCCDKCGVYTLDELVQRTLGPRWAGIGSWLILILCTLALVMYSVIVGDFISGAIKALAPNFAMNKSWHYTLIMTGAIMLPLACLKNMESLKYTSTIGLTIVCYGTALVVIRCIYTYGSGKDTVLALYQAHSPDRKKLMENFSFGPTGSGIKVLLNIVAMLNTMSTSSNCHFNAFTFYGDLKNRNTRAFRRITILAFGIITVLNFIMAIAGYFAFGVLGSCTDGNGKENLILNGLVLSSFESFKNRGIVGESVWEYCGVIGMLVWGLAIAFTFPIIFNALRSALYEVIPSMAPAEDGSDEPSKRVFATAAGVGMICTVATVLLIITPTKGGEISQALAGLVGATVGNMITYILPGLMWIKLNPEKSVRQLLASYFIAGMGILFSVTGIVVNVNDWIAIFKN